MLECKVRTLPSTLTETVLTLHCENEIVTLTHNNSRGTGEPGPTLNVGMIDPKRRNDRDDTCKLYVDF